METKAKYHLYETAHSGIIPGQTVNLVPTIWTNRTITDGEWMTNKTLSALDFRDYFLANMIDAVDEDKKNHYVGKDGIVIDHEKRTISYDPIDGKYVFDNNSAMWCEPYSKFVYTKLNEDQDNRIKLVSGYINYELSPGDKTHSAEEIHYEDYITSAEGIIEGEGTITSFPENCNVVFVSQSKRDTNTTWSSDFIKNGSADYYSMEDKQRHYTVYNDELIESAAGGDISNFSAVFNPLDDTPYTGGFEGGSNYITDNVNMVPSGVLFIY